MLVYGDARRRETAGEMLDGIRRSLREAASLAGIDRHGRLVAALIEAGELAQGIADRIFAENGEVDDPSEPADAALSLARALARQVAASWRSDFREIGDEEATDLALARLDLLAPPGPLEIKVPEGFAHYAVYPEAFLEAVGRLPRDAPVCVVGIRSIGTTLAAMACSGLPEGTPAFTVRPVGHPFGRHVAASPVLRAALSRLSDHRFVIVDEGPGLSGSSIAAVATLLGDVGTPEERLHILPSHGGEPGPEASNATRALWGRIARDVFTLDDVLLGSGRHERRLEHWCRDLVGAPIAPLRDISGGAWREERSGFGPERPPCHPWQERRKFLLETETGTWLLRFAGLGRTGLRKFEMARQLFEGGFVPEPAGWKHGFLVERWHGDARALDRGQDRGALVDRLGAYLAFRADHFPSGPESGASVPALFAMLRSNAEEALGGQAAMAADRWAPDLDRLERRRRPVATDNRLHLWEWLVTERGLLKADALDHHVGHDLVGAQDMAWDVAGATVEFRLSAEEIAGLVGTIEAGGGDIVDPDLLRFMQSAYLAFQLGSYTMAEAGSPEGPDRELLAAAVLRYRGQLHLHLLGGKSPENGSLAGRRS
ncbi:hypothetical protein [uncultured Enterovirga sp.]|uniref:hypothetical protein n=1 Tax=uncultured Enterovirga sp. TaxID=2026352 RepID=UPI0035C9C7A0